MKTDSASWITALWCRDLSNSEKLWVMPCRATEEGWVIVKSSDTTWSTGRRTMQHFSIQTLVLKVLTWCGTWSTLCQWLTWRWLACLVVASNTNFHSYIRDLREQKLRPRRMLILSTEGCCLLWWEGPRQIASILGGEMGSRFFSIFPLMFQGLLWMVFQDTDWPQLGSALKSFVLHVEKFEGWKETVWKSLHLHVNVLIVARSSNSRWYYHYQLLLGSFLQRRWRMKAIHFINWSLMFKVLEYKITHILSIWCII